MFLFNAILTEFFYLYAVMKKSIFFILQIIYLNLTFGQESYSKTDKISSLATYKHDFHILKDSTCYLRTYYMDYGGYSIYKGKIKHKNDSLFEFIYQAVAEFSCNKGYRPDDSLRICLTENDTAISSSFKLKIENQNWKEITLKKKINSIYLKGIEHSSFYLNTNFQDPISRQNIILKMNEYSDPDLKFYGSKTEVSKLQVKIVNEKLTLFPNRDFLYDKVILSKEK